MDIELNPGPETNVRKHCYNGISAFTNRNAPSTLRSTASNVINYRNCNELFEKKCLSNSGLFPRLSQYPCSSSTMIQLTSRPSFMRCYRCYRGRRSGKKVKLRESRKSFKIQSIITPSEKLNRKFAYKETRNINNLKNISLKSVPSSCAPRLRFALWNARSINNKISSLCDLVISEHIDICAITETWLTGNDSFVMADLMNTLQDYNVYSLPRASSGGGVAVIVRKGLVVKQNYRNNSSMFLSFEMLDLTITSGNKQFRLLTIYRPRATKKNKLSTPQFFSEFSKLLEDLITTPHQLILAGDFNFHVDDPANTEARNFLDLLDSSGFQQYVNGSTHRNGHTLDLIFTRYGGDNLISNVKILPELPSDHRRVLCKIELPRPAPVCKNVTYRKLRKVDMEIFSTEITNSSLKSITGSDLNIIFNRPV